ncbi:MAG: O-antigen ligase family protein [Bacteroidales bacterium]
MNKIDFKLGKLIQVLFLIISVFIILFVGTRISWILGLALGFIPLILFGSLFIFSNAYWLFLSIFIFNYYIMGITRYIPSISGGIIMDTMLVFIFISLIINGFSKRVPILWDRAKTPLTYALLIWLIYCILEIFNPESISAKAWLTGVRGIVIYFFVIVILTQIICKNYKQMRTIIFIWSILTLTALIKVYIQKNYGFDFGEKRWLYIDGGARTHIIYSGIRYFSFFSDAATFGCSMAFSFVTFFISAIGERKKSIKIYYIIIALLAIYGMLLSGTRVAIVIPFIGLAIYLVFSKKIKTVITFSLLLISLFFFFKYTYIGQGNSLIRRTRTTFSPDKDSSYVVRKDNQAMIKTYMANKPFGVGIGLSAGRANNYGSYTNLSNIPTDSWLVLVWEETGIVGLCVYICTLVFIIVYGGYIIMFKLRNKELRHYMIGLYGGIIGMIVASYANEAFSQFPNGFIVYTGLAFIFVSPHFDKELAEKELIEKKLVEENIIAKNKDSDNNKLLKMIN